MNKFIHVTSTLAGIDALIVSKDICKLDNDEIQATSSWGIEMMVKGIESER